MITNVPLVNQPDAAERDPALAATAILHEIKALWTADDLASVITATTGLIRTVDPIAVVRRVDTAAAAPITVHGAKQSLRIQLNTLRALDVSTGERCDRYTSLQDVAELTQLRIEALDENAKLRGSVEQLARSEALQRALYAIADSAYSAGADLDALYKALHRIVGTLMYAENFYIALYDSTRENVRFVYYADSVDTELPSPARDCPLASIANGPTWHVLRAGRALQGSMEAISTLLHQCVRGYGASPCDWLGVPLRHGTKVVGCVAVQSYDPAHRYDERDKALLTFVAQHIQTALERRRAHAELHRRIEERTRDLSSANQELREEVQKRERNERLQATLFRIAELAGTTTRIEDFYAAAHVAIGDLLYASNFYIALLSDDGAQLTFPYVADERHGDASPRPLRPRQGLTEYVIHTARPLLADARTIAQLHASGEVARPSDGAVCWLGIPLAYAGHVIGVLAVQSYSPEHVYTKRDQELLTFVSYQVANALARIRANESLHRTLAELEQRVAARTHELAVANQALRSEISVRKRAEARLQREAWYDSLTDLPNRSQFMRCLTEAFGRYRRDPQRAFALLFMDLDRFKAINDSEGHLVGDELLVKAGARIRACLKTDDLVARLGGDEFGVVLCGVNDEQRARRVAERIVDALSSPFRLAGKDVFTSISIGVALVARSYPDPERLIRDADSAMYEAKRGGGRRYALFGQLA